MFVVHLEYVLSAFISIVEWVSESSVQASGVLQLEAATEFEPNGAKWPLGSAKIEIVASKKPGPKKPLTIMPKSGANTSCRYLYLRPALTRSGDVTALTVTLEVWGVLEYVDMAQPHASLVPALQVRTHQS